MSLLGNHLSTDTTLNFQSGTLATLKTAAGNAATFDVIISAAGIGSETSTITPTGTDIAIAIRGVNNTTALDFPDNASVTVSDTRISKSGLILSTANLQAMLAGRVSSTVNTASQSLGNISGLSFAVGANETWVFRFLIFTGSTSAAGIKLGVTFPNGATVTAGRIFGTTTALNVFNSEAIPASGVATTNAYNTVNSQTGWIDITGGIINGATSGTFQVQGLKLISGTGSVLVNSFFTAQKIN